MNRQLIIIISVLLILVLGLIFGFPFEFFDATIDKIVTISIEVLVLLLFFLLYRITLCINKKTIKWLTVSLLILIAIPYFLIGIYTTLFITTNYYPMWEDIAVYTNTNGEKIISQWRETSGSIYDYRSRKIFYESKIFRVSVEINSDNMKGIWTEHLIEKDSSFTINLNKNIVDYCKH